MTTQAKHTCPYTRCRLGEVVVGHRSVRFHNQYWHMGCAERVYLSVMSVDGETDGWYDLSTEERVHILETA